RTRDDEARVAGHSPRPDVTQRHRSVHPAARLRVIENHMSGVTGAGDSKRDRNGTFGKNKNTTNPTRIVGIAHRTAVVIESEKAWMTCERIGSSSARITLGRPCSALTSGTAASASWPTYLGMRVSTRFE